MSSISWAALESFSGTGFSTSTASSGDDWTRSFLTSVARGLGTSFYWPGSAVSQGASIASSGELQLGTMRFSYYTYLGGGFADGFLHIDPVRMALWHHGSTWTGIVGHSGMLDRGGGISGSQRWLVQEGIFSSTTTSNVTFASAYSSAPFVTLSVQSLVGGTVGFGVNLIAVDGSGFTSVLSGFGINDQVVWRAEGVANQ